MGWKISFPYRLNPFHLGETEAFLPNLCRGEGLLAVVVITELLAILIVIIDGSLQAFNWEQLGRVSIMCLWIGLLSALVLCLSRFWINEQKPVRGAVLSYVLILVVTLVSSVAAQVLLLWVQPAAVARGFSVWPVLENLLIAAIPAGVLLRYLYLQQQLRIQQKAELESRIQALQSRIRPHFLFNSMNMIASLIGSDPVKAERVVEDLADLFRHALTGNHTLVPLRDELNLCRRYMSLEKMRLGDRLDVVWEISDYGSGVQIPCLTLQPVLENAVYHGIQLLPDGGRVEIRVHRVKDRIEITVRNPLNLRMQHNKGNKMAMKNVQSRLDAHFGPSSVVSGNIDKSCYITRISYPVVWKDAVGSLKKQRVGELGL